MMGDRLLALKFAITAIIGGVGSLYAAESGSTNVAVGTTLAVVIGFAGLLIQQVFKSQSAVWKIVAQKDQENALLRTENGDLRGDNTVLRAENRSLQNQVHFVTWERERARFRAGERSDPGPYDRSREDLDA